MLTLVLMVSPVIFFGITWITVLLIQAFMPERLIVPVNAERIRVPDVEGETQWTVYVGVHQIAHFQENRTATERVCYLYRPGRATGVPSRWMKDVWRRRN